MKSKPALPSDSTRKDVDLEKTFAEGPAMYLILQAVCPECNKLFRLTLLTSISETKVIS